MHSYYDLEGDVFYIRMKGGAEEEFAEVAPGVSVELNKRKEIIGIEILNASKVFKPLSQALSSRPSPVKVKEFSAA